MKPGVISHSPDMVPGELSFFFPAFHIQNRYERALQDMPWPVLCLASHTSKSMAKEFVRGVNEGEWNKFGRIRCEKREAPA